MDMFIYLHMLHTNVYSNTPDRFNPNLYADGKVCLSLLGTWHGGDATEKWDPQHSNLFQVCSIRMGIHLFDLTILSNIYNEFIPKL